MDLLKWPAPWLAGSAGRFLGIGGSPGERRDKVMGHLTLPVEDVNDLMLFHMARMAVWGVMLAVVAPVLLVVIIPVSLLPGGWEGAPFLAAFFVSGVLSFFIFFMGAVHLLKGLIADYLLEGRWNRESRAWRAVMLAQTPDIVIALVSAVAVAFSSL
ncbi:hypothetical protein AB0C02_32775 [Micromonospora sp. NPDC048999]|uniref:hypothetical protein n=1 Tax=Micromonospora sp. NPDC048999 TaxID=3155391 RepID=UPI003406B863